MSLVFVLIGSALFYGSDLWPLARRSTVAFVGAGLAASGFLLTWIDRGFGWHLALGALLLVVATLMFMLRRHEHGLAARLRVDALSDLKAPACLVSGRYSWQRGPEGVASLTGDRLRFDLEDGATVFDVDVARAKIVYPRLGSLITWRGALEVRIGGTRHCLSFPTARSGQLGAARNERDLWRAAIESRIEARGGNG